MSNFIENILDDEYPNFRNIIHKIESPVLQHVREKTILTEEQLASLLDRLTNEGEHELACMVALAMCSGRRKSELVLFKTRYFNDDCIVSGSLYRTPERIKTKGRGSGKYIHCYTLMQPFKKYFDLWMAWRKEKGIKSEWLFPSHSNPSIPLPVQTMNAWSKK